MLISQMSFEKTFGLSSVFIESTLMENGGVAESANPSMLIKEAIHVISCGYEEKTEWGKEVAYNFDVLPLIFNFYEILLRFLGCFLLDWLDIRVGDGRHLNRFQDALQRMEVNLLHAFEACIQRVCTNQPF